MWVPYVKAENYVTLLSHSIQQTRTHLRLAYEQQPYSVVASLPPKNNLTDDFFVLYFWAANLIREYLFSSECIENN